MPQRNNLTLRFLDAENPVNAAFVNYLARTLFLVPMIQALSSFDLSQANFTQLCWWGQPGATARLDEAQPSV